MKARAPNGTTDSGCRYVNAGLPVTNVLLWWGRLCTCGDGRCVLSVPSAQFCCEPKAALRSKLGEKKVTRGS